MSCNTMRDLEYERERDRENERKKQEKLKAKEREKLEKQRQEKEKRRREKAEKTIRDLAEKMNWKLKEFRFHPGSFHMYKPGTKDLMKIDVLEDGVVRVDLRGRTISAANHPSSEAFFNNLRDILKGTWRTVAKGVLIGGNQHAHAHTHAHTHHH